MRTHRRVLTIAPIDLKHAIVLIQDGYTGGGGWLVNNVAGYTAGAVTMLVDGGAVTLDNGDTFTVAGDVDQYGTNLVIHSITAHSETLGATTSITFTPALNHAVVDDAVVTVRQHSLQIKVGEGNLTYSEKRKIKYILDRGLLDTVKEEDQEPVDVKLDFTWEFLRASQVGDPPTPEEALKRIGNAASWVSSATDLCEIYAVDIVLVYEPPCTGVKTEQIILPDFRWEDLAHDPKTSQIAVTGKCNVVAALVNRL